MIHVTYIREYRKLAIFFMEFFRMFSLKTLSVLVFWKSNLQILPHVCDVSFVFSELYFEMLLDQIIDNFLFQSVTALCLLFD